VAWCRIYILTQRGVFGRWRPPHYAGRRITNHIVAATTMRFSVRLSSRAGNGDGHRRPPSIDLADCYRFTVPIFSIREGGHHRRPNPGPYPYVHAIPTGENLSSSGCSLKPQYDHALDGLRVSPDVSTYNERIELQPTHLSGNRIKLAGGKSPEKRRSAPRRSPLVREAMLIEPRCQGFCDDGGALG
jgi:hypothetical protein